MASFFNSVRQGLNRTGNRNNNQPQQSQPGQRQDSPNLASGYAPSSLGPPRVPPLPSSPSLSSSIGMGSSGQLAQEHSGHPMHSSSLQPPAPPRPLFLNPNVQGFIVKGNYMTLAATPKLVDSGEWLAHQVVMQYRLLSKLLEQVLCPNEFTGLPSCNHITCPSMSAGTINFSHTYTWLDNNRQPTTLPAPQYISLVQKWISGKILDPKIFPTDISTFSNVNTAAATFASGGPPTPGIPGAPGITPIAAGPTSSSLPMSQLSGATTEWLGKSAGFPEEFQSDCKSLYKQMLRIYAHLYWAHFKEPFFDLSNERHLNSSFTHFVTVGTQFDLLSRKDVEPIEALLELWVGMKIFPAESKIALWFGPSAMAPLPSQSAVASPTLPGPPTSTPVSGQIAQVPGFGA
ncbi:MAG: hypothetical protein M1814_006310 [Vezdaea aestivalis]|nr:MAG: hypothetical protein M1814_006310 [Vezdaea aestivalis]